MEIKEDKEQGHINRDETVWTPNIVFRAAKQWVQGIPPLTKVRREEKQKIQIEAEEKRK